MSNEPKSIWKNLWHGPHGHVFGIPLLLVTILLVIIISVLMLGFTAEAAAFDGIFISVMILVTVLDGLLTRLTRKFFLKGWRSALVRLACFVGLIAIFYAEEDLRGWWAWENFKHEWEAKGEKFDRHAYVPPPVSDERNFALTPIVFTSYGKSLTRDGKTIPYGKQDTNFVNRLEIYASDYFLNEPTNGIGDRVKATLTDLQPWQNYYRQLAETTNLFPVPPQPGVAAADVLLALSKYNAVIEMLRQAGQLPDVRFPLDYDAENPSAMLLPHLAPLKIVTRTLMLRSLAELQNGESAEAMADIRLALRLSESIRTEPILISHLVRIAMLQIALQPIYEGLAERRWSDAQLVELDSELAKQDFLADYQFVTRGELALFQVGTMEYARRHPEALLPTCTLTMDGSHPSAFSDWLAKASMHSIPAGWFYQNELHCARIMVKHYIPLIDVKQKTMLPSSARSADAVFDAETKKVTPYNIFERLLLPGFGKSAEKFTYAQSSVNLTRVAIALERYRLAHGEYPESLTALTPQFMTQVPCDVIDGQPLKYRREANGQLVLYSIGWNETDDGGVAGFKDKWPDRFDMDKGDWVWRYPKRE